VSFRNPTSWLVLGLLLIAACATAGAPVAWGQEKINRNVKSQVAPLYPDLARRMRITGTVKVKVVIAPNGTVKDASLVGGHPVLANAALDAARKWRYEAGPEETTGVVEFHFDLHQ
jgi:TonB family protein